MNKISTEFHTLDEVKELVSKLIVRGNECNFENISDEDYELVVHLEDVAVRDYLLGSAIHSIHDTYEQAEVCMGISGIITMMRDTNKFNAWTPKQRASALSTHCAFYVLAMALTDEDSKPNSLVDSRHLLKIMLDDADSHEKLSLTGLFRVVVNARVPYDVFLQSVKQVTLAEIEEVIDSRVRP